LRNAVDFDFPTNTVLAAGARLLVVSFNPSIYATTRAGFIGRYGVPGGVTILGPWSGKLDNSGEKIELQRPDNPNVTPTNTIVPYYLSDKVGYTDIAPWPTTADGTGLSLQRIQSTLYGNDPMNWQATTPTAGQANPIGPMVDADHDGLADVWELANGLDPQIASGTNGASADNDGDGAK
jgi:hypothetical protein